MEFENILRWFQDTAERKGDEPCLRYKKDNIWRSYSWSETLSEAQRISECLRKIGINPYDRVSLLCNTRVEWPLIDLGILCAGAVTVPIYQSNTAKEVKHILFDSEARVIFVEDSSQLDKVLQVRSELPNLEKIIVIEGEGSGEGVSRLEEFRQLAEPAPSEFGARIREIKPDNLATLVYTSGTTGNPKGVMLTHENLLAEVEALIKMVKIQPGDQSLMFLPLAHILARVVNFFQLTTGFTHAFAESIEKLVDNIGEIRPNFMVSVPRIFEKIYQNMMANVEASSPVKQKIFHWAQEVGSQYSKIVRNKQKLPFFLKLKHRLAYKLVFSKLHAKLGGRIRFFVSGGAPLSKEIAEFFHGAGILVLEGYGLTETTAAINANSEDDYGFGTVGKPIYRVEEKIAEDGEILARGPVIAKGYWKRPEDTAEAFTADGWFHTGDIGEFDEKGHLRITDRKKDIIVTAGGKNIAPQNIENMIKIHPLISQVVVHGDKRKFLSALITLNPEEVERMADKLGVAGRSFAEQTKNKELYEIVKNVLDEKNKDFAKYETIKKFAILDKDFTIESGELTPTLKVKRKLIGERYKDIFDNFYAD